MFSGAVVGHTQYSEIPEHQSAAAPNLGGQTVLKLVPGQFPNYLTDSF